MGEGEGGPMRGRDGRAVAVRALVSFGVAAALGVGSLAACDAIGDNSPGPSGSPSSTRPSPKPTPTWDTSPRSVAAVGDSITRGFDACAVLTDCPAASWATGTDKAVKSLAVRLLGKDRARTHSWNYARTGARMADLPAQLNRAAAHKPDLVTVMAGSNDACRPTVTGMTPVADFRADFQESLRQLRRTAPKAQVYVLSVPDLKRLWSQGRGNPLGKRVWKLGICPSMLADPDDLASVATKRRDAVHARVVAYNEVLREVCTKDKKCRYDGGAVFAYKFGQTQLSKWDWFHPSVNGQARLAELAYRGVTAKRR